MIRKALFFIVLLCFVLLGTSSSQNHNRTQTLTFKEKIALSPNYSVGLSIEWVLDWPSSGYNSQALQAMQSNISNLIYEQTAYGYDLDNAFYRYCNKFGSYYRSEGQYYIEEAIEYGCEISPCAGWEAHLKGQMLPECKGVVSYVCLYYDYCGGAHGSVTKRTVNMNSRTGLKITRNDLFNGDSWSMLTSLLRKYLPKCLGDDIAMIEDPDIYPTDDFYVSSNGLTFIYQQYSIGAGALGVVEVTIPWSELPALRSL